ncbi:MAG: hypothetical protein KAS23_05595, partial [Anaerohalosphaera sp.]|nr:hypothetical protein [Anaerohalosphaera sp.]
RLTGFVWGENIGWINLSCDTTSSCDNVIFGVRNDGNGNLSGFAWAENAGWINFDPTVPRDSTDYGVNIDDDGKFSGWAWGENIGWIHFDSTQIWNVQTCRVTLEDLQRFAQLWLQTGRMGAPADIDHSGKVDFKDYSALAQYWLDFCPDGWQLK